MIKLILLCVAAVPTIDSQISAMEVETVLHSGTEDLNSPYMGVFPSRADDVDKAEYLEILNAEGSNQYYRFLAELGIVQVEFVNGGSLALEEFSIPTRSGLKRAFAKIRRLVIGIFQLPSNLKINAARRVMESAFLVTRLDHVRHRSARQQAGYFNHQRTPLQEADAVYKQLFQASRPPGEYIENFDLTKIKWHALDTQSQDMPLKLIVPLHRAGKILPFVLTDPGQKIGQARLGKLRTTVSLLYEKYTRQYLDYSIFLFGFAVSATALGPYLLSNILLVQDRRSKALELYVKFRISFPTANNLQFHIWVHDPEQRVCSPFHNGSPGQSFPNIQSATKFREMVTSIFKKLPQWSHSGHLHDVVLYKDLIPGLLAYTDQNGHVIAIKEENHASVLALTLEHEICHVADFKFNEGMALVGELCKIDTGLFSAEIKNCLTIFANVFFPDVSVRFTTYTSAMHGGMPEMPELAARILASEDQRKMELRLHQPQSLNPDLRVALSALSADDWSLLRNLKASTAALGRYTALTSFTGDNMSFFTSPIASQGATEESAELIRLVMNPMSLGLLSSIQKNDVKRDKVLRTMRALSRDPLPSETNADVRNRFANVNKWKLVLDAPSQMKQYVIPITVVYVSEGIQSPLDEAWRAAKEKVEAANLAGQPVSYMFLLRDGARPRIQVNQEIQNPPNHLDGRFDIFLHGVPFSSRDKALRDLDIALREAGLNYFGQPRSHGPIILREEWVHIYSPCIKLKIG